MQFSQPLHVVAYGGGVNSVATLLVLREYGIVPRAIIMSDPGHEWPETYAYRDRIVRPMLASWGWPDMVVVSRKELLPTRRGPKNIETLGELCERTSSLPSLAYGWKKCSDNYKRRPALWWTEAQPWAQAEWAAGRKLVKVIGYDADESHRVRPEFNDPDENARYVPVYPLVEADLGRDECVELIRRAGLPPVHKSACTFCPHNKLEEWQELRQNHPAEFAYAVAMSRRAASTIQQPDDIGLMRRQKPGRRQLHVWADGGYPPDPETGDRAELPCDCAL